MIYEPETETNKASRDHHDECNVILEFEEVQRTHMDRPHSVTHCVGSACFEMITIPTPPGGKAFQLMKTQVTQELYQTVMETNPSKFKGAQLPVENVTWMDGIALCNALSECLGFRPAYEDINYGYDLNIYANGFRLPFEMEWEWAAKGGQQFKYAGSDNLDEVGWYLGDPFEGGGNIKNGQTQNVGQLKANGYGLHDMSGNVWEWCADDYHYPGQHQPRAYRRILRGGNWFGYAEDCRILFRRVMAPDSRDGFPGLRLSRSI